MRIYELSKQLGVSNHEVMDRLPSLGIVVKSHASSLKPEEVKRVIQLFQPDAFTAPKPAPVPHPAPKPKTVAAPAVAAPPASVATPVVAPVVSDAPSAVVAEAPTATPAEPSPAVATATAAPAAYRPAAHPMPKILVAAPPQAPPRLKRKEKAKPEPRKPEPKPVEPATPAEPEKPVVVIREGITAKELAERMKRPSAEVIKALMKMGVMATLNQRLPLDAAELLANEMGCIVTREELFRAGALTKEAAADVGNMAPRAPVVTIMGHVDHGKTKLLDYIRKTRVVEGEAGGITQHVGAYTVETAGGRITFIDTPGHEAFTAMRARGASVTDIVILVVAANDGVMPQTEEAIHHAQAAGVPIIVAINKVDLPNINLDRVKQQLGEHNLSPEEWGGKTIMVALSAKTGENVDKLLEMILLQSEMMELKACTDAGRARGIVLEARLDKAQGPVATVLIQSGTLNIGDTFVCGVSSAKVRALIASDGSRIEAAGPSTPVIVVGFSEVPQVGDLLQETANEREAREIAEERARIKKVESLQKSVKVSLEDLKNAGVEQHELAIVVKADVQGSIQAIRDVLERRSTAQVKLRVLHGAVGAINDNDINLAAASNALVVGFGVRSIGQAEAVAKRLGVEIRYYEIIYKLVEDIEAAMKGLLSPKRVETVTGHAEILQIFKITKVGSIAGCMVKDGVIRRTAEARLLREGKIVFTGKLSSLKRYKDDVKDVKDGNECGIGIENYNDLKVGDVIEAYTVTEEEATLSPSVG